jgi:hypothetical protein
VVRRGIVKMISSYAWFYSQEGTWYIQDKQDTVDSHQRLVAIPSDDLTREIPIV